MSIFKMIKDFMEVFHNEKEATKVIRTLSDEEKQKLVERVKANFPENEHNEELLNQTIKIRNKENNNEGESKANL